VVGLGSFSGGFTLQAAGGLMACALALPQPKQVAFRMKFHLPFSAAGHSAQRHGHCPTELVWPAAGGVPPRARWAAVLREDDVLDSKAEGGERVVALRALGTFGCHIGTPLRRLAMPRSRLAQLIARRACTQVNRGNKQQSGSGARGGAAASNASAGTAGKEAVRRSVRIGAGLRSKGSTVPWKANWPDILSQNGLSQNGLSQNGLSQNGYGLFLFVLK